jgi:3-phosphoshikimate 1-carboxyvinyltransferase
MKAIVEPGKISGTLMAPPSKSLTQRAYAGALLHNGTTIIHNAGNSQDEKAALQITQQLGARIVNQTENRIEIYSTGINPTSREINCSESGLAARLFIPIASLIGREITINGSGSLLKRPMSGIKEPLQELGIAINGFNGYLPFSLKGPIAPKTITVDASEGSQFLSGLLFALSYSATEQLTVNVTNLKSRPYIDLTLEMLAAFGKPIAHNNYRQFVIDPALFTDPETVEIGVEGDWSSATFFLVAGAIAGDIAISGLNSNTLQADKAIVEVLKSAGAEISVGEDSVTVKKSVLTPFDFDATHCPDLFPALAVLAACCEGDSHIKGVHRLFYKESNRVESVTEMLHCFGVHFSVEEDTLFICGEKTLQGTVIDSYNDHRIAMAAAIGALRAKSQVDITGAEAINKSYPGFFNDLVLCGGKCNFITE